MGRRGERAIFLTNGGLFHLSGYKQSPFLEVMRQPLEDGSITVSRAVGSINYPASFMLVASMNPCVCGFLTDPQKECTCTPLQIQRYRSKVSGLLLSTLPVQSLNKQRKLTGWMRSIYTGPYQAKKGSRWTLIWENRLKQFEGILEAPTKNKQRSSAVPQAEQNR